MQIDIEHVARLARLGVCAQEKELFSKQLSAILEFAENLQKLNTDQLLPTSQAIPMKNVFRKDLVVPCENVEDILKNAPEEESHMFKVPKIME